MEASRPSSGSPPPLDYNGPETIRFEEFTVQDLETDIYTLFERRASRQPNRIALVDGQIQLSYGQLLEQTQQIALAIRSRQLLAGVPIGLWMDKSAGAIAALLAIVAEGHPYVPLDLAVPAQRNESMLTHAGVALLIGYASELPSAPPTISQLVLEQINTEEDTAHYQGAGGGNDIAYILYTSGTTGKPKGVYQHQRGVLHDVAQYVHSIHLGANDRHSLLYSLSVIGSIRDVLGTLLTGGSVHLYHPIRQGLAGVAQFVEDQQITIFHSLPLLFRGFLSVARGAYFPSVRLVYLAGDRIYRADVEIYRSSFPSTARLYVGIGSTENATIYRQWFIDHQTPLTDELIPVGYAVPDRFMRLLSLTGTEVERGEIGEIVVTSAFLSLGYWRDDERTHRSFTTQGT
ncbi:MAG: AMP-dependent synthetase and ligase, partial [Cytophagaceae bacterium]